MRTIIVMALVLAASVANAASIKLACKGETLMKDDRLRDLVNGEETVSVTIDFASRIVTVGNSDGAWATKIVSEPMRTW